MRKLKNALCIILTVLFILAVFAGCTPNDDEFDIKKITLSDKEISDIDADIDNTLTKNNFSGSALVNLNSQTVFDKSYGYANQNNTKEIDSTFVYQISSLTKGFTGVAIQQLEDNGKLSLDDTLDKYFKGYSISSSLENITVRQIVEASVSFGAYANEMVNNSDNYRYLAKAVKKGPDDPSIQDYILLHIMNTGTEGNNTNGSSSNSNYYLLGKIIERASGLSYKEYIQKNIFDKVGMKNTGFLSNSDKVQGYNIDNKAWRDQNTSPIFNNYSFMYSSYGITSTIDDLGKFYSALLNNKLTDSDLIQKILSGKTNYNYGFFIDGKNLYIEGGTPLHTSYVYINTETLETSLLLSNFSGNTKIAENTKEAYNAVNAKVNGIILENS